MCQVEIEANFPTLQYRLYVGNIKKFDLRLDLDDFHIAAVLFLAVLTWKGR